MPPRPSITGEDLRSVMQRVPSPVTVVTAAGRAEARGATSGSFTSVSLDPPLVSFNVEKDSQMHAVLAEASHFAVHLLADRQSELCRHFAVPDQSGADQLAAVTYRADTHGTPILESAPAILHCRWHEAFEAGDHTIVVGHVTQLEERDEARPLLYYDRDYRSVSAPADP
jgi:3-hydroxy-9,10-secoandrosta-1,3,5(10)-triene-9,17-dione monooxygenase reductase component